MPYSAHIRTLARHAEACMGERTLMISAGVDPDRTNTCPVELLLGSLGG